MSKLFFISKELVSGKSIVRSYLNYRLRTEFLVGKILDLGSGGSDRYSERIPREKGSSYELYDVKRGDVVDFECDSLRYKDKEYDTVLFFNVLEHLYSPENILKEMRRIKKENGTLVGFVPFLMWYHADPHDYYRYTHEALERLLADNGYREVVVEKIYVGPYTTAFQMIHTTLPKILRPICYIPCYVLDALFRRLRPKNIERFVLGYYFTGK